MIVFADTPPVRKSSVLWMMMIAGIGLTACSSWCFARCSGQWMPLLAGMNGPIQSFTVCDGEMIAAGIFTDAGGTAVNHIAQWNGTSWSSLGAGLSGGDYFDYDWYALASYEAHVIVGGYFFTEAGGVAVNHIAQWDGISWSALGSGVSGPYEHSGVGALTVYNGDLIVGGVFSDAGGIPANNIARWNGASWSPLGTGLTGLDEYSGVGALTVYNGDLIVAGHFTEAGGEPANNIARWNGTSWFALGSGLPNGEAAALTVYNGNLVVGGRFAEVGGISANNIAKWNGTSWLALGSGVSGADEYSGVSALTVYNGDLIVGGGFTDAGGVAANNIARWDGTAWSALASAFGVDEAVYALTVLDGELIVGGYVYMTYPDYVGGWARWRDPGPAADFDCDFDVDVDDLMVFEACATGPAIPYNPAALPAPEPGCTLTPDGNGHIAADSDEDNDVDQSDFGSFQRCYSGQGNPAEAGCGD